MSGERNWVVQPHGGLIELGSNLWTVEGTIRMPTGALPRRMTVARLGTGQLVIFSAIALAEPEQRQVEKLGDPAYLVVPNGFHREDAPAWKARYPQLRVVTPSGARTAVEQLIPVDACEDVFGDPDVKFESLPGTENAESALVVTSPEGTTLVVNDIIGNVRNARGLMRPVLALMGFAGRKPQVPRMFVSRVVKDKAAVAGAFRRWAALPRLQRILVSHGSMIDQQPVAVLSALADKLSPR